MVGPIGIVTLRVERWQAMMEFYRDRLGLTPLVVDEANQYVMFDTGSVRLALEGPVRPAFRRVTGRPAMMLNFRSESIGGTLEELRGKDVPLLSAVEHGPGYDFVVFADPEGNEHIAYQRLKRS